MKKHINIKNFSIDVYTLDKISPCVIVLPGGGYFQLTENEGKPVAEKLNHAGFSAIVFQYSVNCAYPQPLYEFSEMLCYLNQHAEELNIDIHQLIGIGFSAGGNLLANYQAFSQKQTNIVFKVICLSYSLLDIVHLQSSNEQFQQFYEKIKTIMTGKDKATKKELEDLSPYYHIAKIPTFLWHPADDPLIPCIQSVEYGLKLKEQNIPFELHIFESGSHGLSLADETSASKKEDIRPDIALWFDMCLNFISKHIYAK